MYDKARNISIYYNITSFYSYYSNTYKIEKTSDFN